MQLIMGSPFTPERLEAIRRLRKARRLFKQTPLFAFEQMVQQYPNYTYAAFIDDLRIRRKRKPKQHRSILQRYGRYAQMDRLIRQFEQTGDYSLIEQANRLRANMTKPYRLLVKIKAEAMEFTFSAMIPMVHIERLSKQVMACVEMGEVEKMVEAFRQSVSIN